MFSINEISIFMIIIGLIFIITIIILPCNSSSYYNCMNGWIAVFGASFIFGSTGIPMKSQQLHNINVQIDPLLFAVFTGIGIFVVNFPLAIYLLSSNEFVFEPWAILGSFDIFIINYFAFQAVRIFGFAKASALWAGTGMLIAFIWGSFAFNELISNMIYAGIAISLLVCGVYLVSTSQTTVECNNFPTTQADETIRIDQQEFNTFLQDKVESYENDDSKDKDASSTIIVANDNSILKLSYGYILCLTTGFFDGSLMVPFKLSKSNDITSLYNYLASFGISSLFVCPTLYILYVIITQNSKFSTLAIKIASIPGLLSGILWAMANFLSVHATYYLGIRVGFPLTQTCVIVTAAWGIFYFKEIVITMNNFIKFSFGLCFVVIGSYFMAMSSDG